MKQVVIVFKAKEDLLQAIDRVARMEDRTRSGMIRHAINEYLDQRLDIEAGKTQVDLGAMRGES